MYSIRIGGSPLDTLLAPRPAQPAAMRGGERQRRIDGYAASYFSPSEMREIQHLGLYMLPSEIGTVTSSPISRNTRSKVLAFLRTAFVFDLIWATFDAQRAALSLLRTEADPMRKWAMVTAILHNLFGYADDPSFYERVGDDVLLMNWKGVEGIYGSSSSAAGGGGVDVVDPVRWNGGDGDTRPIYPASHRPSLTSGVDLFSSTDDFTIDMNDQRLAADTVVFSLISALSGAEIDCGLFSWKARCAVIQHDMRTRDRLDVAEEIDRGSHLFLAPEAGLAPEKRDYAPIRRVGGWGRLVPDFPARGAPGADLYPFTNVFGDVWTISGSTAHAHEMSLVLAERARLGSEAASILIREAMGMGSVGGGGLIVMGHPPHRNDKTDLRATWTGEDGRMVVADGFLPLQRGQGPPDGARVTWMTKPQIAAALAGVNH